MCILTFPRANKTRSKVGTLKKCLSKANKTRTSSVCVYANACTFALVWPPHCTSPPALTSWAFGPSFCQSDSLHYSLSQTQPTSLHSGMMRPFIFPLHWDPGALRIQLGTGPSQITHKPFLDSAYRAKCWVNDVMNTCFQHVLYNLLFNNVFNTIPGNPTKIVSTQLQSVNRSNFLTNRWQHLLPPVLLLPDFIVVDTIMVGFLYMTVRNFPGACHVMCIAIQPRKCCRSSVKSKVPTCSYLYMA